MSTRTLTSPWRPLLTVLAVLLAAFVALPMASAQDERPAVPNFELSTVDGDRVELSDFAGSVVVINFWATWCDPCQAELPHLQALQDQYAEQGLVVLTIATDGPDTFARVRSLVRRNRWSMRVLTDQDGAVTALLNPAAATPYTIFVDRQGRRAHDHEGYSAGDEAEHEARIQELLAETAE